MFDKIIRKIVIIIKRLIGRGMPNIDPVNLDFINSWPIELTCEKNGYINDLLCTGIISLKQYQVFPKDNAVSKNIRKIIPYKKNGRCNLNSKRHITVFKKYSEILSDFIKNAKIPDSWRHGGLYYAGYSLEHRQYILPSWVWTNGKVVEWLINSEQEDSALELADHLLENQLECGGWVARYDYDNLKSGISPIVAPNDCAHCAEHGLITAYRLNGNQKYLVAAEKCANWIINEGNKEGMVLLGFNILQKRWNERINILDVGFTSGLFCKLYQLTGKREYIDFAGSFLNKYVKLFYRGNGVFATALQDGRPSSKSIFARGHGWALEGLIPYYEITRDTSIKRIIEDTVNFLLKHQEKDGGWLYNLRSGPIGKYSGYDNKGIPVIAASLTRWKNNMPERSIEIDDAVRTAIDWCIKHTKIAMYGIGGIFSPNFEGAIVHSPNKQVAFVYANCYLLDLMKEYNIDYDV